MKIVIVFNHPYEGSFCNAILESVTRGLHKGQHETDLIYLDKENFNPIMTAADLKAFVEKKPIDPKVIEYADRIDRADHLIFIFPIWWEVMPALTKGFIDKVMFPGVAYDYKSNGIGMVPLFKKLQGVTVISTMNTPKILYRLIFGNAIRKSLITGTFWKTGYKKNKWINLAMVKMSSDEKRKQWLVKLEQKFSKFS